MKKYLILILIVSFCLVIKSCAKKEDSLDQTTWSDEAQFGDMRSDYITNEFGISLNNNVKLLETLNEIDQNTKDV